MTPTAIPAPDAAASAPADLTYFDNAATTLRKPPEVAEAVVAALGAFGGAGRGAHRAALTCDMAIFRARETVARLLGVPGGAGQVAFCSNATEALNTALLGLVRPGDHVVTTAASHNSVLRPLYRLRRQGAELDVAPIAPDGSLDLDAVRALMRPETRVLAVTHASNLTGDVYDVAALAQIAHEHGALIVVDAAQTAGAWPIDMAAMGLDAVCFTGHKALYGPQGTGGIAVARGVEIAPLKVGGSGVHSYDEEHPAFMPERLEAGTPNGHGIAGLAAGASFVMRTGVEAIRDHERSLVERLEAGVARIPGARLYGGRDTARRCGIVALNLGDQDSGQVAARLDAEFGICVRPGAHCAPLMHRALGTQDQGAVRFGFSWFNTADEVDRAVEALAYLAG